MVSVIYFLGAIVTYLFWCTVIHRKFLNMSLSDFTVMSLLIGLWPIGLPILIMLLWEEKR